MTLREKFHKAITKPYEDAIREKDFDRAQKFLNSLAGAALSQEELQWSLAEAAGNGGYALAVDLVQNHDVKVNEQSRPGGFPLVRAIAAGDVTLTEFFLHMGAKPNIQDGFGMYAAEYMVGDPTKRKALVDALTGAGGNQVDTKTAARFENIDPKNPAQEPPKAPMPEAPTEEELREIQKIARTINPNGIRYGIKTSKPDTPAS